jgi:hypothetical protein
MISNLNAIGQTQFKRGAGARARYGAPRHPGLTWHPQASVGRLPASFYVGRGHLDAREAELNCPSSAAVNFVRTLLRRGTRRP